MKNISFVLFLLSVLFLTVSCGDDSPKMGQGEEMEFEVNPALLGDEVFDNSLGIKFSPPKEWNLLDPESFAAFSERISKEVRQEKVKVTPRSIYSSAVRKCLLTVSTFEVLSTDGKNPFDAYRILLSKEFDSLQLNSSHFTKSGIKIYQHLIQSGKQVNFKLLFEPQKGKFCQFDYVILKTNYNKSTAKAIESSIGSILLINSNHNNQKEKL